VDGTPENQKNSGMMKRILIVDDQSDVREILSEFLSFKGYDVIQAENGESALQEYCNAKPDVAVVDVEMPKMNGLQFSQRILEKNETFPIIIISAYLENYSRSDINSIGVKAVMQKPLDLNDLYNNIQAVLT
jgi:DNA-binding response OmpR family regulator